MANTLTDIGPDSRMEEVLEAFPGARRALFRKYHIGGCSSCGFSPEETLAGVCGRNDNLDTAEVLDHIRTSHEQDEALMIDPGEVASARTAGTELRLLDVRTREEFEAAKIEGAILMNQDIMQEILGQWDREALVVLIDHEGRQALDAASFLQGHGFGNVRCLRGGIDAWSRQVDSSVPRYRLG